MEQVCLIQSMSLKLLDDTREAGDKDAIKLNDEEIIIIAKNVGAPNLT